MRDIGQMIAMLTKAAIAIFVVVIFVLPCIAIVPPLLLGTGIYLWQTHSTNISYNPGTHPMIDRVNADCLSLGHRMAEFLYIQDDRRYYRCYN